MRLSAKDRDFLKECAERNVMLIQAADRYKRLGRRGLVTAEFREGVVRDPVACVALTDAGRAALTQH
jgi:hypothetical protein